MVEIKLKPVSVNELYLYVKGRRILSKKGRAYKENVQWLCPRIPIPEDKIFIRINFYFSSAGSDIDNCTKAFMDAIFEKFHINDNRVYKMEIEKFIVKKGSEKIEFEILPFA